MADIITFAEWEAAGLRNGWSHPPIAQWPLRLPVIRYLRVLWLSLMVERHYAGIADLGLIRTGYDDWVLFGISKGFC